MYKTWKGLPSETKVRLRAASSGITADKLREDQGIFPRAVCDTVHARVREAPETQHSEKQGNIMLSAAGGDM